jgi:hypothetical protein
MTSTFENVSDTGVCLGLGLAPPAIAGVRSKQGAVQAPDMGNYRRDSRKAVAGSISVNRDLTMLALVRLVTSASVS